MDAEKEKKHHHHHHGHGHHKDDKRGYAVKKAHFDVDEHDYDQRHYRHHRHGDGGSHYYYSAYHDSGCYGWIWFFMIFIFVCIIFIPLIVCWTGNCDTSGGGSRVEDPDAPTTMFAGGATLVHGGAGGHPIQGLKSTTRAVASRASRKKDGCGPGDVYNATMQCCYPRLHFPRAMDQELIDMGTDACDSFYRHACGEFLQAHDGEPESADRSFSAAWRANQFALKRIVRESPAGSPVHAYYTACVETMVNGKFPQETAMTIRLLSQEILGGSATSFSPAKSFALLTKYGFTAPWTTTAERHPTDAQWSSVLRFAHDNFPVEHRVPQYIQTLLTAANPAMLPEVAERKSKELSTFLTAIAAHEPQYPADMGFLEYLRSAEHFKKDMVTWLDMELTASKRQFAWSEFLETLVLPVPKSYWPTWIQNVSYFRWLFDALAQTPVATLRLYVEYSIAYHTHQYMPDMSGSHNSFRWMPVENRQRRRGMAAATTGEEDCVHATQHMLPGQIALAYMKHRDLGVVNEIVASVTRITERIVQTLSKRIGRCAWLSAEDKRRAQHKLRATVIRVGHPHGSTWSASEDFAKHSIRPDQYVQNLNAIRAFRVAQNLHDWQTATFYNRSTLESDEQIRDAHAKFGIPLSMVNAFYDPSSNTITVPLGILQAPFFDTRYDETSAYAAIGSVIGHELAHAFDPHGILFDSHGSFHARGPWSPGGMEEYTRRTQCVSQAYSTTTGLDTALSTCASLQSLRRATYGERTLGESLSDLVGTRLAYEALTGNVDGTEAMTEQRLAQTHAFFYSYAQMWCAVHTVSDSCNRLLYDVHATAEMRVDHTLRQLPEYFAAAFHCREGTGMYSKTPCVVF